MNSSKLYIKIPLVLIALIVLNYLGNSFNKRFDLTKDKRYSLLDETKDIIDKIDEPIYIKVYLQGDFPSEFKRIQLETNQFLEELSALNDNIKFRFIDPKSNKKELIKNGLQPSKLTVQEDGVVSESIIFPWATINFDDKIENVSLLSNSTAPSQEEQMKRSIENLEYEFANALHKIISKKDKKIAILKGNGELEDIYLYSFLKKLSEYYKLAEFTLDSVKTNPEKTLSDLIEYDLVIVAKPTKVFTEEEKFTLDQYILNNGKTLWLIDNIAAEMDSLMANGKTLALNRDLNLTDLFFNYGVRINYNVTKDLYSSSIRLASGNTGNQTQYQDFLWHYFPLTLSNNNNPISSNLDPILLKFPSSMDTLKNNIKKTALLQSSPYAKIIGTPTNISLNEISNKPIKEEFNDANTTFGVLLEGEFKSAYTNRTKPFNLSSYKQISKKNAMVIISDGDIIANETFKGEPLPLSIDKWTNQAFGNADLLLNTVHYLLDDSGIINLRSKNLQIQFLDKEQAFQKRTYWQVFNIILPLIILGLFGFVFNYLRKRKYSS
ncbi:MAG: gliding motility-associated ABC transporter substrate-binding protein GldG [Flavobacteriaceae bacterium]|nr:gliding motility-associated ABC transporter substrate-binding protein GldG [Flavobacteriaceae bacterium]